MTLFFVGNGTIEFDEFLQMMANRQKEKNENLLSEAFVVNPNFSVKDEKRTVQLYRRFVRYPAA